MLITFADRDGRYKPDETGHNKIGYVTTTQEVIFPRRGRVIRKSLRQIQELPHRTVQLPEGLNTDKVERFFVENFQTTDLFLNGLTAIVQGEFGYFDSPIRLPKLEKIDLTERSARWDGLLSAVRAGDVLFTFDSKSFLSKGISLVDHGPWSHTAICSGEGTVIEAIASGVQERPLAVYSDSRYRVGLYRAVELGNPSTAVEAMRSRIGKGYSFRKAAIAGIQKFFGMKRIAPTPNDLAVSSKIELVMYV